MLSIWHLNPILVAIWAHQMIPWRAEVLVVIIQKSFTSEVFRALQLKC